MDKETIIKLLEMVKRQNKELDKLEGMGFKYDGDLYLGTDIEDMIFKNFEIPKDECDPFTGEGFCRDFLIDYLFEFYEDRISGEELYFKLKGWNDIEE